MQHQLHPPPFHANFRSGRSRSLAGNLDTEAIFLVCSVNYGLLPQTWEDPAHKAEELDGIAVRSGLA